MQNTPSKVKISAKSECPGCKITLVTFTNENYMGILFYCISISFIASRIFNIILLPECRGVRNCVLNYKNFKLVNTSVPGSDFIQIKSDTESTPEFQGRYI